MIASLLATAAAAGSTGRALTFVVVPTATRRSSRRIGAVSVALRYNNNNLKLFSSASATTAPTLVGTPPTSFDDGKRPFQITTPIYYVNDKPHIGHAYTSIACDVLARYMRLAGREVFFLSGTDEHGQKVQQSAAARGMSPQEFVDTVSVNFRDLLSLLHISSDYFIRTTEAHHKQSVQYLWNLLVDKGYIYLGTYEGWYSVRDECFYTESELTADGKAPTGANVEWVTKEESYFFKLSAFQDALLEFYEQNPDFMAPPTRAKEVLNFVSSGLRDLSVSRTSFSWGIPIPKQAVSQQELAGGDDDNNNVDANGDQQQQQEHQVEHVMYVWMDALCNYVSALGYPPNNSGTNNNFVKFWPAACHVVGKDILRFHAVYWPAILMAAGLPLPKRLFAHGWWTKDGQKISKSLGNVIDPIELVEKYGVDQTRFFLMAEVAFGNDGDFSHLDMVYKVNSNLANELGNLCQRTLSMVYKNCNQAIPTPGPLTDDDKALLKLTDPLLDQTGAAIAEQAIFKYIMYLVDMIRETNKYIDSQAPWSLRKTDPARADTVLYVVLEVLRRVVILYQPVIPTSAERMLDLLTVPSNERTLAHLLSSEYQLKPGSPISQKPQPIFPRIEVPVEA